MAAKPRKKAHDYLPYPPQQDSRVGCKVSWYIYAKREDAETAAIAAQHNATIQSELGYDFGYCSPGSIEQVGGGWEVCIP